MFFITNVFYKFKDVEQYQDNTTNWKSTFSNSSLNTTYENDKQGNREFRRYDVEKERRDAQINGLHNRVDLGGKNVKRRERSVSPVVDDNFDEMGNADYNIVLLGYRDHLGQSRNHGYEGVIRDGQFNQEDNMGNFRY